MFISGVAIGQWNNICKNKEGKRRTVYKITRAICVGDITHVFPSRAYIVRYYDLNLLVDHTGCVMTVWRDISRPSVEINEEFKKLFDNLYTHNEVLEMATDIHSAVQSEINLIQLEQRGEIANECREHDLARGLVSNN